jgi:hypothetical protein
VGCGLRSYVVRALQIGQVILNVAYDVFKAVLGLIGVLEIKVA